MADALPPVKKSRCKSASTGNTLLQARAGRCISVRAINDGEGKEGRDCAVKLGSIGRGTCECGTQ
eukprot:366537-Chlamydomonas_euryale.AAC.15